jgi:hypothetical protein
VGAAGAAEGTPAMKKSRQRGFLDKAFMVRLKNGDFSEWQTQPLSLTSERLSVLYKKHIDLGKRRAS